MEKHEKYEFTNILIVVAFLLVSISVFVILILVGIIQEKAKALQAMNGNSTKIQKLEEQVDFLRWRDSNCTGHTVSPDEYKKSQ